MSNLEHYMQPEVMRLRSIPVITVGYICSDNKRKLFSLAITFGWICSS